MKALIDIMTQDTLYNEKNSSFKVTSQKIRQYEIRQIKKFIKEGYEIIYAKTNNWIRINNITFNGYTRKIVDRIIEELNNDL